MFFKQNKYICFKNKIQEIKLLKALLDIWRFILTEQALPFIKDI